MEISGAQFFFFVTSLMSLLTFRLNRPSWRPHHFIFFCILLSLIEAQNGSPGRRIERLMKPQGVPGFPPWFGEYTQILILYEPEPEHICIPEPICILCLYYWCLVIISLRITFPATKVKHSHVVTTPTYHPRPLYVTPIVYDSSGQRPEVKAWPLLDSVWQSISDPPPNMLHRVVQRADWWAIERYIRDRPCANIVVAKLVKKA